MPTPKVSQLVAERGGYDLLPEMGYKPVNKYLPPRARRDATDTRAEALPKPDGSAFDRLFQWADKVLSPEQGIRPRQRIDHSGKLEG